MALIRWIASVEKNDLEQRLLNSIEGMGLEIDHEFSSSRMLYARDKDGLKCSFKARVKIFVSSTNEIESEYQFEVRSSEPMLRRGTRCEQVANEIKSAIPPRA